MMNIKKIIIGPILTEKGSLLTETQNKYLFKVDKASNKIEIKRAIEKKFGVNVGKVAIINVKGKTKRASRNSMGKRADWKKAYVTLADGADLIFLGE